jgi:hypothetical protein
VSRVKLHFTTASDWHQDNLPSRACDLQQIFLSGGDMITRCTALGAATALCAVFLTNSAHAASTSVLDMVVGPKIDESIIKAGAALDQIGKDRIDQFLRGMDDISTELLRSGANQGRLGLVQAGNEIQIAIGVARSQFGAEADRQISNASAQLRPILVELQRWRDAKDQIIASTLELEDLVAMDLGRLPLSPDYFGIRRVTGTALLKGAAGTYRISVSGDNFGTEIVGQDVSVSAKLEDQELAAPEKKAPEKVFFNIPAAMVSGKFKEDSIATIPFQLTVTRIKNHWIFGSLWPDKTVLHHNINLALLPTYVGKLTVKTERPKYAWVEDNPVTIKQPIAADTVFQFPNLNGEGPEGPLKGNQRYGADNSINATCSAVTFNAWSLFSGEEILADDPLFKDGWQTDFYVGEPESPDWNKADDAARKRFGWTPGFAINRCSKGNHCKLSADEIKKHSTPIIVQRDECNKMWRAETTGAANRSNVAVWIRGRADHNSLWSVTAPVSTYKQIGTIEDPKPKTYMVYAGKFLPIDIENAQDTVSLATFEPSNGGPQDGVLGQDISKGPKYVEEKQLGGTKKYLYRFEYDAKLFDVQ